MIVSRIRALACLTLVGASCLGLGSSAFAQVPAQVEALTPYAHQTAQQKDRAQAIIVQSRKTVKDIHDYMEVIVEGKDAAQQKGVFLSDVSAIRPLLSEEGMKSADVLTGALKASSDKIDEMKPVWKAIADLFGDIAYQIGPDGFHLIVQDDKK